MNPVEALRGDGPIILGQPHGGTFVPAALLARLNDRGRELADTDWHINRLYDRLLPRVTVVQATFHRYVIDANRDPAGVSLYPGQNTTGLCPTTDFDGVSIWAEGQEPGAAEIAARIAQYHAPYHQALATQIDRIKALHGVAVIYDCHSIRSRIPFLFTGRLPDFSIGTNDGRSCAKSIADTAYAFAMSSPFDTVLNGRFKGGWTTRHYGDPAQGAHAIQMEIAQSAYLSAETAPWVYDVARAEKLRRWLADILTGIAQTALETVK